MIICGLPNEEWAQKRIRNIAQYIINQKTKGRWPKHAGRLQRACGTHSASRRGTLELAGWQGVLLPREFTSVAAAEHGQHTWSVVWGRQMGLSTPRLRRWWWLSQAAGGTKTSCFVHGNSEVTLERCWWCFCSGRGCDANNDFPVPKCK